MFRKNYLPKVEIKQDFETRKWFAYKPGDVFTGGNFVVLDSGDWDFCSFVNPTPFNTLAELLETLYWVAYKTHLKDIKSELTYKTVKIKT